MPSFFYVNLFYPMVNINHCKVHLTVTFYYITAPLPNYQVKHNEIHPIQYHGKILLLLSSRISRQTKVCIIPKPDLKNEAIFIGFVVKLWPPIMMVEINTYTTTNFFYFFCKKKKKNLNDTL